ncbi:MULTISPECIES: beta-ketoacyl-ACP synthase II [Paracoccus]|jgi:3-oxoacyl-[acyl-carrier-protein] synthase II|uniref:3-oxoacyl-[acyl-carrier-protein] synthase 2 n=1 Tax=Paracoccus denitrificans (strain Pd 1222) TaxID=318586 RepID=A1B644_PARDP|nr:MULTISPECIES: beta-ketoacyl-ACP synthase II [Paracoccus]ABL70988.1 3-oxoacyl-[acyl-carrier-protein] synthase II [Paracoccus denitrificans PD1222]MBB4626644.1 3-oxoacyl-[acyl-carrier-protein] synthase II [Paracoccus denitrificans]MCU7428713.1 beta-ketoacyl-ACP synthase II [Paracoccus denitrificans]QAR27664.1 beta-ketoacyl-[acyl-carrier-protein] synthase II [Paracoccus denitrificans]UFS67076.1 beta-ketoacyl-ACP synthase II [Paracoccus denitrificans]
MRRVVVTGLGMVTPLASGVEETWSRLLAGESGAGPITRFDTKDVATKYACEIPLGDGSEGTFNPDDWMEPKDRRKVDDFILYGMAAAEQAVKDSGWEPANEDERERTGVMIGSGIGGLRSIAETAVLIKERGPKRVSPFFIPGALINLVSGQVSIRFGFKGPNHAVVTACSTGAHAIGDAARLIALGDADVMVAGGTESPICEIGIAGFNACKALSTKREDDPKAASRPWDEDRDGFVMGEGAGVVVLEEYEHAKARGARIYAEILGYGLSGDAYHITAPSEDGDGGFRSMTNALKRANLSPGDLDYINAHGTSTMADVIELGAVERLLGDAAGNVVMSSTKSSIGHLLGAAGAVEAIFCILAIRDQICPPTINLDNQARETAIDLAANAAVRRKVDHVLSNSFGFGGTNASLVMGRVKE